MSKILVRDGDFRQISPRVAHQYCKRGNVGIDLFQRLILVRTLDRSGFPVPQADDL